MITLCLPVSDGLMDKEEVEVLTEDYNSILKDLEVLDNEI